MNHVFMNRSIWLSARVVAFIIGLSVCSGAAVAALVIGTAAAPAGAAGAPNAQCHSGDILTGTYNNVTVVPGNYCLVLGATVLGNIQANGAVQIGIDNSGVHGNVSANNVTQNGWVCGSTIGGNQRARQE